MKKTNRTGSRLLMALVFIFLYAPIFLLIIFSFNAGDSSAVWKGFSLSWYGSLFKNRIIMESVYTTLLVSILATIIATVAGTFAAIGLYSLSRRWRDPLLTVNNIPMMNADIVTGVGLCLFFAAFFRFWGSFAVWFNSVQDIINLPTRLHLGFTTLLLAHIAFNIPYVILNVAPKLRQMDKNLVDAGRFGGTCYLECILFCTALLYSCHFMVRKEIDSENNDILHSLFDFHLYMDADCFYRCCKEKQKGMVPHTAYQNNQYSRSGIIDQLFSQHK